MAGSTVFISYSHQDEKEKNALLLHLGVLRGAGLIDLWSDDRIGTGADWERQIDEAMARARVAVLLISANFLTSEFILRKEVPTLLKHRQSKGLVTYPVIAKECAWKKVEWLRTMNVRPKNGIPVWGNGGIHADEDLTMIAYEVADIVSEEIGTRTLSDQQPNAASPVEFRLFIVTEEGKRYETMVRANVPIAHLVADFLAAWLPSEDAAFVRHSLRSKPGAQSLDNTLTLAEAGVSDDMTLYLVAERILPTSSVGLIVEDDEGHRFVTNVLLDTPVKRLATEFVNNLGKPIGRPIVELLGGPAGKRSHRLLRNESTLYEEQVQNGAHLRVLAKS